MDCFLLFAGNCVEQESGCCLVFCWILVCTNKCISTQIMQGLRMPLDDNLIRSHMSLLKVTRPALKMCQKKQ